MKPLSRKRQSGFSAIIAIVLIVILALLGAYAATTVGVQSLSTTQSVGGMQAWFAARAGIDTAVYQAVVNDPACPGPAPFTVNPGGAANGFSVQVQFDDCAQVQEGPDIYNVYQISATASRGGNPGDIAYVSRTIQLSVSNAP